MICAKCGANNPSESAYCGGCGSFLAPGPETAMQSGTLRQEPESPPPAQPVVESSANEDMPTFHTLQPTGEQARSDSRIEEAPTARATPVQPTPAASEFVNIAPQEAPREVPGANVVSSSPAPGQPMASGPLPVLYPGYPQGVIFPQQGQVAAPGYPQGMVFPQQGQVAAPGYPQGVIFPQQGQGAAPGYPQGMAPGYPQGMAPGYSQPTAFAPTPQPTPFPGFPQATPLPVFPPVQGQPSGEFPAGTYPLAGQPVSGVWGAPYTTPESVPQTTAASTQSTLINPLPLWAFIGGIVVVALLLVLLTFFTGSDWAGGAKIAGVVALIIGVLLLIAFGVRTALGMLVQTNPHRSKQIISSLLLILLLIAVGGVGLLDQAGLHSAQAHTLASQSNWQMAITEYQASGQGAPSSEDIAQTYVSWGDQLVNEGQFAAGITKFEIVINSYNLAPTNFSQAKSHAIDAYQKWANQDLQAQRYDQATQHYDKLLTTSYCDSACQSQVSTADATAYYKLAEQKLHQQPPDYAGAVAAFNQLTTRFSSSPSSQSAHADYATALWGDAQQLLTKTCSSALTIYQQLSSQFSDTPQGQQATSALTLSVSVTGHFTSNIPSGNTQPVVLLVQGLTAGMTQAQLDAIIQNAPRTNVDSNGDFKFTQIKQGSYYLIWGAINQTTKQGLVEISQRYPAAVGPLCGFDFGDINESFPKV